MPPQFFETTIVPFFHKKRFVYRVVVRLLVLAALPDPPFANLQVDLARKDQEALFLIEVVERCLELIGSRCLTRRGQFPPFSSPFSLCSFAARRTSLSSDSMGLLRRLLSLNNSLGWTGCIALN